MNKSDESADTLTGQVYFCGATLPRSVRQTAGILWDGARERHESFRRTPRPAPRRTRPSKSLTTGPTYEERNASDARQAGRVARAGGAQTRARRATAGEHWQRPRPPPPSAAPPKRLITQSNCFNMGFESLPSAIAGQPPTAAPARRGFCLRQHSLCVRNSPGESNKSPRSMTAKRESLHNTDVHVNSQRILEKKKMRLI
ncbi:hypothetical protein EVAR_32989_1 [Eumeta japonica]|uniref:Uncharacterized protein n=1 Tax=Eumeta variegata TaxID=151549 RepID=A0A4C1VRE8_EUMVA|nr:hypothetical protein EVAR_32989_1 [Eumeta japonica]